MVPRAALLSVVLLGLSISLAHAHPGHAHLGHETHGGHGFAQGLIHPWTGLDHLLAMLAVGLLAAGLGGRMLGAIPAVFLASMLGGAGLGGLGVSLPGVEVAIALSVVLLGAALAMGRHYPELAVAAVVCLCGLLHGHAHGAEMPLGSTSAAYLAGMLLGSSILLLCGIGGGLSMRAWPLAAQVCGGTVAAAGLVLLLSLR